MASDTASPARRSRGRKLAGLASALGAAFWMEVRDRAKGVFEWIVDKAFGDAAFQSLTSGVRAVLGPVWSEWLWAHGPTIALVGAALYLFFRPDKQPTASATAPLSEPVAAVAPAAKVERAPQAAAPPPAPITPPAEPDWSKLYELSEDGTQVRLRFLPDTERAESDALLLVVFGYKALKGHDRVPMGDVHAEMLRAYVHAPNSPLRGGAGPLRPWGMVRGADGPAQAHINRGNLVSLGLAAGGAYQLTAEGEEDARMTARDLIRRA